MWCAPHVRGCPEDPLERGRPRPQDIWELAAGGAPALQPRANVVSNFHASLYVPEASGAFPDFQGMIARRTFTDSEKL